MNNRHRRIERLKAQQHRKELQKQLIYLKPEEIYLAINSVIEAVNTLRTNLGDLFIRIGKSLKN